MNIAPLTEAGLAHVLANLTDEDRAEFAASGLADSIGTVFNDGWLQSDLSGQVEFAGVPVAAYGCLPAGDGVGVPWMVATPGFRAHPKSAMAVSHQVLGQMQTKCRRLMNWVHVNHTYAMRWLPRLRFTVGAEHVGPGGEFRLFTWSAEAGLAHVLANLTDEDRAEFAALDLADSINNVFTDGTWSA